ncbi:MAG: hypothetical protein JWQ42_1753 [Edaphobacter sp.]|nr:hypothetical protein [Edaphobacter sp.]
MNLVFLARTSVSINKARGYLQTAEKELERVAHIVRQRWATIVSRLLRSRSIFDNRWNKC